MTTTVKITGAGEARAMLERVAAAMRGDAGIMASISLGVETAVKDNFVRLNQQGNRLGGERTNYWLNAAAATVTTVNGNKGTVECAHTGVALHLHGGTVRPSGRTSEITGKSITRLTIPVHSLSHGKSVATLRALGIITYRSGGALFHHPGLGGQVNPDTDAKLFVLAKQANVKARADVLPTESALADAAANAARDHLAALGLA